MYCLGAPRTAPEALLELLIRALAFLSLLLAYKLTNSY